MKTRRPVALFIRRRPVRGPLWRHVAECLAWEIEVGRLATGARLPASRTLARELGVSRNTITVAYDELVTLGYVSSRVGDGSYVAPASRRLQCRVFRREWRMHADPDGNMLILIR